MATVSSPTFNKGDRVTYAGEGEVQYVSSKGHWAEVKTANDMVVTVRAEDITVELPVEPALHTVVEAGNDKFIRLLPDADGWRWLMTGGGLGTVRYTWAKVVNQQKRAKEHAERLAGMTKTTKANDAGHGYIYQFANFVR